MARRMGCSIWNLHIVPSKLVQAWVSMRGNSPRRKDCARQNHPTSRKAGRRTSCARRIGVYLECPASIVEPGIIIKSYVVSHFAHFLTKCRILRSKRNGRSDVAAAVPEFRKSDRLVRLGSSRRRRNERGLKLFPAVVLDGNGGIAGEGGCQLAAKSAGR